ncbi:MAG: hypothetical protein IJY93_05755 [Clostridia bacterium]|nr:hypothetical protein [Clostridia bacterium]
MKTISLLKDWQLREEALHCTAEMSTLVANKTDGWMNVPTLPCDVHMALKDAGRIKEPLISLNTFDCKWIEERSWWFSKTFTLSEDDLSKHGVELFIEMLDIHADIFLNGTHIAHHASAMYAFRKNVRPWLKAGENTLLIRLTTGAERPDDTDVAPVRDFVACEYRSRREGRGNDRRTGLRKPQYVFGWDQSPHLATCAISGDVRLEILDEIVVRDIRFETLDINENGAKLLIEAEVESRERLFAREMDVELELSFDGKVVHTAKFNFLANAGVNYCDFSFTLENPELWWPNGYGKQPLYTARVSAVNNYGAKDEKTITTGIRTVRREQLPMSRDERCYYFIVNGKRVYCKGMDVIHSDVLYARTTKELEYKLITAARDANFTILRFWDGYMYQSDYVHELCDRFGIMTFENFCFACGAYPDHLEEFRREVEAEAIYQLRRLRNHPCVAMWIGNGECHGLLANYLGKNYFNEMDPAIYTGGTYLYNELLPKLHHAHVASVDYQCCTPWGGFEEQEVDERGARHYYPFLDLSPENQQNRISVESFDPLVCKFITECGVMGPPSAKVLAGYLGGEDKYNDFKTFEHHRNTFERFAVRDGIYKHYTGEKDLSLDEYCLYGGLFQGTLLSYAADKIRINEGCGGSVLWCLTDGFGEVGFSLMDHNGDPKPVYYYLRRAYSPTRLIMKRDSDKVNIYASNDTANERILNLTLGYVSFDGVYGKTEMITATLPAFTKTMVVGSVDIGNVDLTSGVIYARPDETNVLPVILRTADFRELNIPRAASLTVSDVAVTENEISFTVSSDIFAHAVHFDLGADAKLSDEYFDLLPSESRRITLAEPNGITADDIRPVCVYIAG